MNGKKTTYIGLLSLSMLLLSSCDQEEPTERGVTSDGSEILFVTSLPGVATRAGIIINDTSIKNGFYVSAGNLDDLAPDGKPSVYFQDELVTQTEDMGNAFRSANCRWPSNKGENDGHLRFFAFYPSRKSLSESAGNTDAGNFELTYNAVQDEKDKTKVKYEYWMKKFKVNKDISLHSDFVTATVEGNKTANLFSGVNLALQHQLSSIYMEAFVNSDSYDVEIAGVRIGGIALESDFSFEGTPERDKEGNNTRIGRWTGVIQTKGCVEYIFCEGDTVVSINKENNPVDTKAVSIMGKGGRALVIPYDYSVWQYSKNPTTGQNYLYFSVLLRVKEKVTEYHTLLYPYIEGVNMTSSVTSDKMHVVYLSVDRASGKVMKRVYKKGSDFFTDPDCSADSLYSVPSEEEVRNYGWASAIPSTDGDPKIRWNPGYNYFYRFDYSKGIGVQDPADAFPGKPIISPVDVTGTSTQWHTVTDFEEQKFDLTVQE